MWAAMEVQTLQTVAAANAISASVGFAWTAVMGQTFLTLMCGKTLLREDIQDDAKVVLHYRPCCCRLYVAIVSNRNAYGVHGPLLHHNATDLGS